MSNLTSKVVPVPFLGRVFIVTILPMIISYRSQNFVNEELFDLLHENNVAVSSDSSEACAYLRQFTQAWLLTAESIQPDSNLLNTNAYLLWARILPVRCDFQRPDGVITVCNDSSPMRELDACALWGKNDTLPMVDNLPGHFAKTEDIRIGGIRELRLNQSGFETHVLFNDNFTVSYT